VRRASQAFAASLLSVWEAEARKTPSQPYWAPVQLATFVMWKLGCMQGNNEDR
jgi:hypothetical protein